MARTIHLGYTCQICQIRIPVYTFASSNGGGARPCTPPVDRYVECPSCHTGRHVAFSDILSLDRWEDPLAA